MEESSGKELVRDLALFVVIAKHPKFAPFFFFFSSFFRLFDLDLD